MALSSNLVRKLGIALGDSIAADELRDALDTTALLSSTEAGYLDSVTAGTAAASKALVLSATKGITLPDGQTTAFLTTGTYGSTASLAVKLSSTNDRPFAFLCDDGGANIAASVRNILGRTLLTIDQSGGSIRSVMGQLKLLTGIDVTTGIYTAVQGYIELVGTHICKTGATFSCFDASTEIGTSLTVNAGGEFYGVHIELTGSGTLTTDSTADCAAIGITKASGAASWPMGIYIPASAIGGAAANGDAAAIQIGDFAASSALDSGIEFSAIYTGLLKVYGESSTNLTSAINARCGVFRHLVAHGTAVTAAHETYGVVGQVVLKNATLTHLHAGVLGAIEAGTAATANGAYAYSVAGVMARVGTGTSILVATKPVCGFAAVYNAGALSSGASVAFAACSATATNFTYFLAADHCDYFFYAATGSAYESGVKVANITGIDATCQAVLKCKVGSTDYWIPMYAASELDGE